MLELRADPCAAIDAAEGYACDGDGQYQCDQCRRYFCDAHIGEDSEGTLYCGECDPDEPAE